MVRKRNYAARELQMLRKQRRYDIFQMPLVWLWVCKKRSDTPKLTDNPLEASRNNTGYDVDTSFYSALGERQNVSREKTVAFYDPIPLHISLDKEELEKRRREGQTVVEGYAAFYMSRAESRRIGGVLKVRDRVDFLRNNEDETIEYRGKTFVRPGGQEYAFVPRPDDIIRYQDRYFIFGQSTVKFLEPTDIASHIEGVVVPSNDSTIDPGHLFLEQPTTYRPSENDLTW